MKYSEKVFSPDKKNRFAKRVYNINSMKSAALLFISIFALCNVAPAFATDVSIHNSVNTSNTTTTTSNCKTHVTINENGVTKTIDSDCGNVNYQSPSGNTKIDINNNVKGTSTTAPTTPAQPTSTAKPTAPATPSGTPYPTASPVSQDEIKAKIDAKKAEVKKTLMNEIDDFLSQLADSFKHIFKF